MEFAYRFRPLSRLLSDDGESGELEGLYIFFAAPEQLNDPLEGFKEVLFCGDSIVWENLIRHYIRCLIIEVFRFLSREPGEKPKWDIEVFASAETNTDRMNFLNEEVYISLTSERVISEYIGCLTIGRKMRRWELINHLTTLHIFALDEIFEALHREKLYRPKPEYFSVHRDKRLSHIAKLVDLMSDANNDKIYDELFRSVHRISDQYKLISRLNASDYETREPWFHLLFDFPERYCLSLDKLIYPPWYTACFMASCVDSSIWGTYGGNHRDVCLKFKVNKDKDGRNLELLAPTGQGVQGIMHSFTRIPLHDVSYEKDFVEIDFFQSLGHLPRVQMMENWYLSKAGKLSECAQKIFENEELWRDQYWKNFYHAITVKLKAWDREQESRLILSSTINDLSDPNYRKLKYEFDSLEGIIFGINTSTDDKIRIIRQVKILCYKYKRARFSFYQARYNQDQRSICYEPLPAIKVGYNEEDSEKG
ncbi:hypothetical protein AAZU54_11720 [Pseudomonas sp. Je.1.5.c]|uniref:hypothetical protein n=1 Tax=Pseudomonas sp. Je.1.5.c TaxID=3142839 RepID=UPI003DA822BE